MNNFLTQNENPSKISWQGNHEPIWGMYRTDVMRGFAAQAVQIPLCYVRYLENHQPQDRTTAYSFGQVG